MIRQIFDELAKKDLRKNLKFSDIYNLIYNYVSKYVLNSNQLNNYIENILAIIGKLVSRYYLSITKENRYLDNEKPKKRLALEFYKNSMDLYGLKIIGYFQNNINVLVFRGCQIDDEELKIILSFSRKNKNLMQLDLMYNLISDAGCESLKEFIIENKNIYHFSIGNNKKITTDGFEMICEAIKINQTLTTVNFQGLRLDYSSYEAINTIISCSKSIEYLLLQNNDLGVNFLRFIYKSLEGNSILKEVNFSCNGICRVSRLPEIILNHKSLKNIILRGNLFYNSELRELYDSFKQSKNIKYISVYGNDPYNEIIEKIELLSSERNQIN
jgi:hypothetical protein